MFRRIIVSLCIVGVVVGLAAGGPTHAGFDRRAMLRNLADNLIIPAFREFDATAEALNTAVQSFAAAPTPERLKASQSAWVAAFVAWNHCELYAFRRLTPLFNQINKWPTNPKLIEGFIEKAPTIDERFVEGLGSTSRGLPAIEYFIFDPQGGPQAVLATLQDPRRMAYLRHLAENLRRKAAAALLVWLPEGGNFAESFVQADMEGGDVNGSIAMFANQIVILLDDIILRKVAKPMGTAQIGGTYPELMQAGRSGQSLAAIGANLASVRAAFNGGDGLGLDDYLESLGNVWGGQSPHAHFNAEVDKALGVLNALSFSDPLSPLKRIEGDPFAAALANDPTPLVALYTQTRVALRVFKTEVAANLGILVLFTDGDGD